MSINDYFQAMKIFYLFVLLAVTLASCNEDKQLRLLLTFEFENTATKKKAVQKFKELQLNEFTELEAVGEYEWAFYFDGSFSGHGISRIFKDEDSFQLAPLSSTDDLDYFFPELMQKGILTDYNYGSKLSHFNEVHLAEVEEAIAKWTAEVGPLAAYSIHIDKIVDFDGSMTLIVLDKSEIIDMNEYITAFIFELDVYEGQYDTIEKLTCKFEEPGATIFKDLTIAYEGKHLAIISKGEVLSIPMVNAPITQGTVEITGNGLIEVFVNKVFLKDVPGAKLVKMEWIQI